MLRLLGAGERWWAASPRRLLAAACELEDVDDPDGCEPAAAERGFRRRVKVDDPGELDAVGLADAMGRAVAVGAAARVDALRNGGLVTVEPWFGAAVARVTATETRATETRATETWATEIRATGGNTVGSVRGTLGEMSSAPASRSGSVLAAEVGADRGSCWAADTSPRLVGPGSSRPRAGRLTCVARLSATAPATTTKDRQTPRASQTRAMARWPESSVNTVWAGRCVSTCTPRSRTTRWTRVRRSLPA